MLKLQKILRKNRKIFVRLAELSYDCILSNLQAEVGSSALHVAVAALHLRQCSGSARYIFK